MIDKYTIIHPSARLDYNVSVGTGSIIGKEVFIGRDTWIGPHVVIHGPSIIGKNNKIFQFSSIGNDPQDIKYNKDLTKLEIGNNNIIREYCMISRGTEKGKAITKIGNGNYLMAYSHIGHDCIIGNNIVMVNYSALSGHVTVDDYAVIGSYSAIHQFCHIGIYSFIAKATYITKDVLPYVMISSNHNMNTTSVGINTVALRRHGFSSNVINYLRRAYKIIFRKGLTVQQAISELYLMKDYCLEISILINALNKSKRGIVR